MIEYHNHRDYHDSLIESNLQNELPVHYDINSIVIYNNNNNNNFNYDINSPTNYNCEIPTADLTNYELLSDTYHTLLSVDEIEFIKDIFNDSSSVSSLGNLSIADISSVDSSNVKKRNKSSDQAKKILTTYSYQQNEMSLEIMKRNFEKFQLGIYTGILSSSAEELSRIIYLTLHPKCLVRFKLINISARSGPKSLVDCFNLLKKAFPDGQKAFMKEKVLMADGYYVYKRKFVFSGTESNFEDSFNFFSYCSNIKDILYFQERKDNFIPNKYCIKVIATRYVDPLTYKVVLCDIGLDIVSQKPI